MVLLEYFGDILVNNNMIQNLVIVCGAENGMFYFPFFFGFDFALGCFYVLWKNYDVFYFFCFCFLANDNDTTTTTAQYI